MPRLPSSSSVLTRRDVVASGAAVLVAGALGGPALAQAARVKLRLLGTTDLHVNVLPYDYYRDQPDETVGLARTAALIRGARAEARNAILFDNGDLIQGSPMGDWVAYKRGVKAGEVHPIFAGMNELDYACATLGNHEFNYGLTFLGFSLSGAKFPFVCANLVKSDGSPLVKPWIVLDREVEDESGGKQRLRIGVIGFVPPQIMQWDQGHLAGKVSTTDIVEAARKHLPELDRQSDLVVALCHSGIEAGPRKGGDENAALYLSEVPGIDAIFTGHQHKVFPGKDFANLPGVDADRGTLNGIPSVMAGFWGSHLGIIDLGLEKQAEGWKVVEFRTEARAIYERREGTIVRLAENDEAVAAAVAPAHDSTLDYVRQPVGESSVPITSFFALVADDPSVQIVAQAQSWYVQHLAAAQPALKDLPVLSAAAPFKAGGRGGPDYYTDVKAGPIAIKDVADLYLYPNTVRAVKVTGAQVREWLERSAGLFNRIDPARRDEQALISPDFPSFNFDVLDGVTYRIDVTQPARYAKDGTVAAPDAHRIVDLRYNGQPIDPAASFLVATNNYRAGGGGHFPGADGSTIVLEAPDSNRDVLVRYIVEKKTVAPAADGNWTFVPWPEQAVVTFETSPHAAKAPVPASLKLTPLGDGRNGFMRFRIAPLG
jgi:2',3'-cyclic-nucleotide 2'-phosphodiesterase / 3'-nucleotidase